MRIAVAATAPFGADVLERLAARHEVVALLTRPDRPAGRGRTVKPPAAKVVAERLGIRVLQPERPTHELDLRAETVVVCAYGLLIPESLLELRALAERPPVAPAALAWSGARRARVAGRRHGDRRHDSRDGRRARCRADRGAAQLSARPRGRCGHGLRALGGAGGRAARRGAARRRRSGRRRASRRMRPRSGPRIASSTSPAPRRA